MPLMPSSMNSPLRLQSFNQRNSVRIAALPVYAAAFNADSKSSKSNSSDEDLSDSPLRPEVTSESPELLDLEQSIRKRKSSNLDLVEKELSAFLYIRQSTVATSNSGTSDSARPRARDSGQHHLPGIDQHAASPSYAAGQSRKRRP